MRFLVFFLCACRVAGADLVFSGTVERVGSQSISVRLQDRRLIDARLPRTGRFALKADDRIEITCRPIRPVWEDESSRFQLLELTRMRLMPSRATEEPHPKPILREAIEDQPLAHARDVNLDYAEHLPNFVADETVKRYSAHRNSDRWNYVDTIESEITLNGTHATRGHVRRDGKPWDRPFQSLPGFVWYGGFGTEIRPLFDVTCPTTLTADGTRNSGDAKLLSYRFESPGDGCFGQFTFGYQRFNPARTGHVFLGSRDSRMIEYEETASGFPSSLGFSKRTENAVWDYVRIGDASHLLPVHVEFQVVYSSGERWRLMVEYTNHRHFESSSKVDFK